MNYECHYCHCLLAPDSGVLFILGGETVCICYACHEELNNNP